MTGSGGLGEGDGVASDPRSEVLFGQAYYLQFDPKLHEAMQPFPPLGTLYAASCLRARGYGVALFDAMLAGGESEWDAALERAQPRFAVLFEDNFNYLSKMCLLRMRQAAFTMVEMARRRGCTVIVAGSDASDHADEYLARGADAVLLGEGEATLMELVDRLSGRSATPLESIRGLAFRDANRRLVRTPRRPEEGPDPRGVVTIEMKTTFMKPARGRVVCVGKLLQRSASLCFCEGTVYSASGERLAHATGTFKFLAGLPVEGRRIQSPDASD